MLALTTLRRMTDLLPFNHKRSINYKAKMKCHALDFYASVNALDIVDNLKLNLLFYRRN